MAAREDSGLQAHDEKGTSSKSEGSKRTDGMVPASCAHAEVASETYINQWNQLVSTTNWEKGRIICAWRQELAEQAAPQTDYSDEAWANLVGGVTGQHVGRLRRVYQQFGEVWTEYPGLYWSHFQVGLEWDDAEMWLEGAVQNGWSVSQMRAARWEAHGAPASQKPRDEDILVASLDEDSLPAGDRLAVAPITAEVRDALHGAGQPSPVADASSRSSNDASSSAKRSKHRDDPSSSENTPERSRPFANLPDLPDDVADAFEQFKLVILSHKLAGWSEISREDLIASLDALKELAMLPADD